MKKLFYLCVALLLTFATASAFAATDVTGTWSGQYTSPDGSVVLNFDCTLKQDGDKLTGSLADPRGNYPPLVLSDGKVDGDKITFNITFNGVLIKHEGRLSGDEIKLTEKSDSADFPTGSLVLKRAKPNTPVPAL